MHSKDYIVILGQKKRLCFKLNSRAIHYSVQDRTDPKIGPDRIEAIWSGPRSCKFSFSVFGPIPVQTEWPMDRFNIKGFISRFPLTPFCFCSLLQFFVLLQSSLLLALRKSPPPPPTTLLCNRQLPPPVPLLPFNLQSFIFIAHGPNLKRLSL